MSGRTAKIQTVPLTTSATALFIDGSTVQTAAGGVDSVFGRSGVIVAASGDYTVAQVTGAAPLASPTFSGTVAGITYTMVGADASGAAAAAQTNAEAFTTAALVSYAPLAAPIFTGAATVQGTESGTDPEFNTGSFYASNTQAGVNAHQNITPTIGFFVNAWNGSASTANSVSLQMQSSNPTGNSVLHLREDATAIGTTSFSVEIDTTVLGNLTAGTLYESDTHTPSSSSDTGITGQFAWDASFFYVCVATNTWLRAALITW